ncbi:adenosylcobinamide-phosphate synthase CbiB [Pseudogemmobacter faecipullorum]|uniref:Cobalamin biosynthesis protein CobD n=1 Tax=Pseudogemmobacter faecipullorum TaxID=2755041 RepID=A0ABS8CGX1_9RHOB|nr:adenosylcobinamide-phosphate synthase CbiB [Pseudogemmobacter faecipullorum]MCB5408642.1 cobalamin biosynthesis protein [Pseudogemmobacter faecipullorum]
MSLVIALILDALFGEPRWLWNRIPHPAVLMGRLIGAADRRFNRGEARRLKGLILLIALVAGAGGLGWLIGQLPWAPVVEVLLAAILLAQRSLADHVSAVASALRRSLPEGRSAVAMIVGRDTAEMREADVTRAAVESAAENLSDGVIAPAFWFAIGGLPGILIYKIVNTADSMIGHMTPRHQAFGEASARFDDLLNLIPARLTALLLCLSSGWTDPRPVLRDAPKHRSPNAGWPEAALAPVLNLALAGPRSYNGIMRSFPWVWPEGRREGGPEDIDAAVRALWRAWGLMLMIALGLLLL